MKTLTIDRILVPPIDTTAVRGVAIRTGAFLAGAFLGIVLQLVQQLPFIRLQLARLRLTCP